MMRSHEAEIDIQGNVKFLEPVRLRAPCRAVITILESVPDEETNQALLYFAESALARDWERPEEEKAWSGLHNDDIG